MNTLISTQKIRVTGCLIILEIKVYTKRLKGPHLTKVGTGLLVRMVCVHRMIIGLSSFSHFFLFILTNGITSL